MASFTKRGKNSFTLYVELGYDDNGKRLRKTKTIKVDPKLMKTTRKLENYLEEEWLKFKMEVEAGEYIEPQKKYFKDFVQDWSEKHAENYYARKTYYNYMEKIKNYILPRFGGMRMDQIKTMHIVDFLNEASQPGFGKRKQLSSSTVYEIDKTLRILFKKAVTWQVISKNPMESLERPKIKKRKPQFYSGNDFEAYFKALDQEPKHWRLFFLTALITGFRRGELVALEWPHIDFDNQQIKLVQSIPMFENGEPLIKSTKTDEDIRVVDMPKWYMEELDKYHLEWKKEKLSVGDQWTDTGHQFIFHTGFGQPYHPETATGRWRKIIKKYDLKDIRLHDHRHSMISWLLENGGTIKEAQIRAGHSSMRTTSDIYGHLSAEGMKKTAEKFNHLNPKEFKNQSS